MVSSRFGVRIKSARRTFVALTGQRDNVGDSLLRRPLLTAARATGECHVLVGERADDYATNLGLSTADRVYSSRSRWLMALARSAVKTRTNLILNAGEINPDARFTFDRAVLMPLLLLIRLRGGAVVQAGIGVRHPEQPVPFAVRMLLRLATFVAWRDEPSQRAARSGQVIPDWGFAEGSELAEIARRHADERPRRMAFSIRGDRPRPSDEWVSGIRGMLRTHDVQPVVVCQVRRDGARAAWLAEQLDAELLAWDADTSHRSQERLARDAYASCDWVVSDRLHGIIMAMTEGAVVLPFLPDRGNKLARTLAAGSQPYVFDARLELAVDELDEDQRRLREALTTARNSLEHVRGAVGGAVDVPNSEIAGERAVPEAMKPTVVLHSIAEPAGATRYSTHMAATASPSIMVRFFSWRAALLGSYDVFHLHWPEHLVGTRRGVRRALRSVLCWLLIGRLRMRGTPVVRTLHNTTAHDGASVGVVRRIERAFERLTTVEIHLVREEGRRTSARTTLSPHGSYEEPFQRHPRREMVPGRMLYFGLLKKYKGVEELVTVFQEITDPNATLRIVGKPVDDVVERAVRSAAASDSRISLNLAFVPDDVLVAEISEAELVVLPYRELHSSGAVLVALSLGRRVLIPESVTAADLRDEVGAEWVHIFSGELGTVALEQALSAGHPGANARPDLSDRTWERVRVRHAAAYDLAVRLRRRKSRGALKI